MYDNKAREIINKHTVVDDGTDKYVVGAIKEMSVNKVVGLKINGILNEILEPFKYSGEL